LSEERSSSDDAILQQVPNICDLLGLKRFTPKKLIWEDSESAGLGMVKKNGLVN
jgi:hypothetical protein